MTKTTPKPLPSPLAMSVAPNRAESTPVPIQTSSLASSPNALPNLENFSLSTADDTVEPSISNPPSLRRRSSRPHPKPAFPAPKLRLECHDLSHSGSSTFFQNVDPSTCLAQAVNIVLSTLYHPTKTNADIPPTRSVTLILRPMDGVAYTCGSSLDDDHKEMHFSLNYISGITSQTPGREADEVLGVLVHEMVHAWQWNGKGKAPGGLIEGIADFVRLKAKLQPPHWKREIAEKWDQGYQHTAYFLEWLESSVAEGCVMKINTALKDEKYEEDRFWPKVCGKSIQKLWNDYQASLEDQKQKSERREPTMADHEFWNWVRNQKTDEETIILKAIWRTRRHDNEDLKESRDKIGLDLQSLWQNYLDQLDAKAERL